jgi:enhancing lycopene biosynthesis protein 2
MPASAAAATIRGSTHAGVPELDALVLFGGFDAASTAALDDGWSYGLGPR